MSYYFSNFCVEAKEDQKARFAPSYNIRGRCGVEPWGPRKTWKVFMNHLGIELNTL